MKAKAFLLPGERKSGKTPRKERDPEGSYNCLIRQWPINHPVLMTNTFERYTEENKKQKGSISARGPLVSLSPGDLMFGLAPVMAVTCRCKVRRR